MAVKILFRRVDFAAFAIPARPVRWVLQPTVSAACDEIQAAAMGSGSIRPDTTVLFFR